MAVTDGTSTQGGGQLSATVTDSQFSSLSIYQTGCCPAEVYLYGDNVAGAVSVTEGLANGDGIVLDAAASGQNDNFGSTTLIQGDGPAVTGCDGSGGSVYVDNTSLKDLTINQALDGAGQSIAVGTKSGVEVALTSFGILATQGNGDNDEIEIVSITTSGRLTNNFQTGPDSVITGQGNGANDQTRVDSCVVYGNIESTQGDGRYDFVAFYCDTAGWTTTNGPMIVDNYGLEQIIQGDGDNDTATLDCGQIQNPGAMNIANNVVISQGAAIFTTG
ncbi:MAG: hypothetical protein ACLP7Q_00030 [Isosphaeraceae bacterium]